MNRVYGPNSTGICRCACGLPAPTTKRANKSLGLQRGEHHHYIVGHRVRLTKPRGGFPPGVLVDEVDRHFETDYTWRLNVDGYVRTAVPGTHKELFLHRAILPPPPGMVIDHINGDKLDNRRENLRIVTRTINSQNRIGASRNSGTGIRNVHRYYNNQFRVVIQADGKVHYFGPFADIVEAADVAKAMRLILMPGATQ